jgi:transcriptional regulator with XRE-family HTH domain
MAMMADAESNGRAAEARADDDERRERPEAPEVPERPEAPEPAEAHGDEAGAGDDEDDDVAEGELVNEGEGADAAARDHTLAAGWTELGAFIQQQRNSARLSVRKLSALAGISNPYLSQIERGLRKPSAPILQQIAKALRISAETLYVRAGILEPRAEEDSGLVRHILADTNLVEDQRQILIRIYLSFLHENGVLTDEHA